ncbi:GNAT family N-acetyltransferase [Lentisalinibacter sediminis]|uniref:GNAT family N-acetyltransferase n=1 Tax=Lentisalinibacter sediminis TaxID=2992237 RepID=UPI003862D635
MCRRKARLWGPLTLQRLELTGELWREAGTVMSEYLDLVVDRQHEDAVLDAFARYLGNRRDWGQLVAANTRESSLVARLTERRRAQSPSAHLDRTDALTAYRLDLRGGFSDWVSRLPGATRRKAVAHRRRCPDLRHVEQGYQALEDALDIMAGFHESRWGRVHFRGLRREFLLELAERDGFRDRIRLSMLCDGDRPVSVMYNLRAGDAEYNIQSAFMPHYSRGISLGYLHIGYSAEALCESGVAYLDLLAGPGRARNYKRDFAGEATEIATQRLTRAPTAAAAYRLSRRWRGR